MRDEWEKSQEIRINGLRAQVAKHDATIAELRAQVATLTERLDRCTSTDDYGDVKE